MVLFLGFPSFQYNHHYLHLQWQCLGVCECVMYVVMSPVSQNDLHSGHVMQGSRTPDIGLSDTLTHGLTSE